MLKMRQIAPEELADFIKERNDGASYLVKVMQEQATSHITKASCLNLFLPSKARQEVSGVAVGVEDGQRAINFYVGCNRKNINLLFQA